MGLSVDKLYVHRTGRVTMAQTEWVFCGHLVHPPVGLFVDKGLQKDIAADKGF